MSAERQALGPLVSLQDEFEESLSLYIRHDIVLNPQSTGEPLIPSGSQWISIICTDRLVPLKPYPTIF
jgi:hypothetical protein